MKRYRLNMIKFIEFILALIAFVFIVWFAISYIDIVAHNLSKGSELPSWNIIRILLDIF